MKVHPKTVQDFIYSGALPAARVGRAYVLMTKDVLAFVEEQIVRQTAARMRSPLPAGGAKLPGPQNPRPRPRPRRVPSASRSGS